MESFKTTDPSEKKPVSCTFKKLCDMVNCQYLHRGLKILIKKKVKWNIQSTNSFHIDANLKVPAKSVLGHLVQFTGPDMVRAAVASPSPSSLELCLLMY